MKKMLGVMGAALLFAAPAMADEVPQNQAPVYNCDYQPSCEVAPGIYGNMYSPVKSKFNLSIGGYVKLDYAYNSVNLGNSGSISPSSGQIPSKSLTASSLGAGEDQSILSARQSRLWFKVQGPTFLGAKTSALIESDFYGDPSAANESPQLRMRLAYGLMDWANTQVLFGQAYDAFGPMIASTQDFRSGAPYGAPNSPRIPQLRVTQKINLDDNNQFRLVAAVQDPSQFGNNQANPSAAGSTATVTNAYGPNVNYNGQITYTNKYLGTAPGYFGMSMNPLTITAFGQYGQEKSASNNNHRLDTWGYGLYTFVPVLKSKNGMDRTMTMSFEGQIYKAGNMAYNNATSTTVTGSPAPTAGVSNIPAPGPTSQTPAQNWAVATQLIFYPTQNLGLTGGWGSRYAYNITNYQTLNNYVRQSQEGYFNVAYDLNAAVRVAAEYQLMQTVYGRANGVNGHNVTGTDNTYRFCAYYFF